MILELVRREATTVRRLLALVREQRWFLPPAVALGLLASLVEGIGLSLFIPLLQAFEGDSGGAAAATPFAGAIRGVVDMVPPELRLTVVILTMLAAIVVRNLVQYANTAIFAVADARASDSLRRQSFTRVLALPLAAVEQDSTGRLLNAIGTETWRVSQALGAFFNGVTSLCALAVLGTLLLLLSWQLTLAALGLMAMIPLLMHVLTRHITELGRQAVATNTVLAERMWASFAGIRIIRAFGRERYETERFGVASDAVRRTFTRLALVSSATGPTTEILITVVMAVLALLMDPRLIDLPTLVAFIAVLYRLQPHARQLLGSRATLLGYGGAIDEVAAVISAPEDPALKRGGVAFEGLRDAIRLDAVGFTYPGATDPALIDLSFAIPRGATVAVVGPSGAGKSTLVDLMLAFHPPSRGAILVDGTPLESLDVGTWRARLAVVSQDPYLADATLRENVLYGRPEASADELEEAARAAHADEFIRRLPRGWDTEIGERGVRLSGGQRQRLALARALIRAPDLLILDEATNALDSRTERAVQDALAEYMGRCTMLIVAHRLATIERADLIVVLDHGRLVEQGSFAALIEADGLFAQMYRLQSLGRDLRQVA
ncbi:MAG TPA: ABC transporter ATP-binding protein [Geminicoccaceae bacterium]|nr:ABC transporter ATP-binding protein [Geminicoccaceae bacterium]